jgi:hypothetical protein
VDATFFLKRGENVKKVEIPEVERLKESGKRIRDMKRGEYEPFTDNQKAENFRILAWRRGRKPARRTIDGEIRIYITK